MAVQPIPDGYHTVTPYLMVKNAPKVIRFLEQAFDGTLVTKVMGKGQNGQDIILNAEVRIGTSMVLLAEARDGMPANQTMLYLYFEDVDKMYDQAIKAGGESIMAPEDMPYGDRSGAVIDPSGNSWWLATCIETLSPEEISKRMAAMGD